MKEKKKKKANTLYLYVYLFFQSRNTEADTFDDEVNGYKRKKLINKVVLHICFLFFTASIEQAIQNEHDKTLHFTRVEKKKWDEGKLNRLTEKKNMAHFVAISLTEHDTLREGTQTNYASDAW